jgi:hypothetical protein
MVIYGNHKEYWSRSFIIKKLNDSNIYWKHKFVTDHLSLLDKLKAGKALVGGEVIFTSLESGVHSLGYRRPYRLSEFNITHKNVPNSFYYTIFTEDYLNKFIGNNELCEKELPGTIFVCSNYSKIQYVQKELQNRFKEIHFFGAFSKQVPGISGHFHLDSRHLISRYRSAICIENSEEEGYIQGNFLFALLSGTVPIIKASEPIVKNILNPNCYLRFSEFIALSKEDASAIINLKSNYLLQGGEIFTALAKDYLNFVAESDLSNISRAISISQSFRRRIFNL